MMISGEFLVTSSHLDYVELKENGFLRISNELDHLTIDKLVNKKTDQSLYRYDILVTGKDGMEGGYATGENGSDGENGGHVKITVHDLVGDIRIRASGGWGGCGGSGKNGVDGADGGDGGNGGNGGDGAIIDFTYDKKTDPDGINFAYVESFSGGNGGDGGNGGNCINGCGLGGQNGEAGGKGARCGNGGKGGMQGKNGKVTIHHPDGSTTVNQTEYAPSDCNSLEYQMGCRMMDYSDDVAFRRFLEEFGGERGLLQFPDFKAAIVNKRKKAKAARHAGANHADSDPVRIVGSIPPLDVKGIDGNGTGLKQKKTYEFYKMSTFLSSSYINASTNVPPLSDAITEPTATAYMVNVKLKTDQGTILYNTTLYDDNGNMNIGQILSTDAIPTMHLLGRTVWMEATVTYVDNRSDVQTAYITGEKYYFNPDDLESYINQITVTDPHWKKPGKQQGDIIFLYGRTIEDNRSLYEDADYYDTNGYYHHNQFHDGILRTIIPMTGYVTLNNIKNYEVKDVTLGSYVTKDGEYERPYLSYGINQYMQTIVKFHEGISSDELVKNLRLNNALMYDEKQCRVRFDFKFPTPDGLGPYDWNKNLSGSFIRDSSHKCYLAACFVLNVAHKPRVGSSNSEYTLFIYSTDAPTHTYYESEPGASTVYIPPIQIFWGCHGKGTRIRLADGTTEKAVEDIKTGDVLIGFGGKKLTVSNILTGEDETIYHILTQDGRDIRISAGHAMKCYDPANEQGKRVPAARLKAGDLLMTESGITEIQEICVEPYGDTVYNFIFEGQDQPNYILANGLWSGDFYAQNQQEKQEIDIPESTKAVLMDMKQLSEKLKQRFSAC